MYNSIFSDRVCQCQRMKVKTCAYLMVIAVMWCILTLLVRRRTTARSDEERERPFQAAIVTLTKGDLPRLLNMLHSIEHFFPESIDKYPVIIFYDPHGTHIRESTIDHVRSCVKLRLIFENIVLFDLISTPSETIDRINHETPTVNQRQIGYRFKCQFWSHTVFYHPAIKNNYDYIMRLDDDSYFLEPVTHDLFLYAYEKRLDYIYRALESNNAKLVENPMLWSYLQTYHTSCKLFCLPFQPRDSIHSGFFVTRLQMWYRTELEAFFNYLLENDKILIHSLEDGRIHAVVLALASNSNRVQMVPFAYAHQIDLYGQGKEYPDSEHDYQNWFQILSNRSEHTCRALIVIEPNEKKLKYITLKQ